MTVLYYKVISITYKNGNEPGTWNLIQVSARFTQYTLHGEILESVDCVRYLGVSISKDLSWNTHISQITSKANRTLDFVKRNVRTKNQSIKEIAYKTLVRPQAEYASTVWSPYTKQNIHKR